MSDLGAVFSFLFCQDWFAFTGNGSEFNFTLSGEAIFPNSGNPTADENYGFCQVRSFDSNVRLKKLKN